MLSLENFPHVIPETAVWSWAQWKLLLNFLTQEHSCEIKLFSHSNKKSFYKAWWAISYEFFCVILLKNQLLTDSVMTFLSRNIINQDNCFIFTFAWRRRALPLPTVYEYKKNTLSLNTYVYIYSSTKCCNRRFVNSNNSQWPKGE